MHCRPSEDALELYIEPNPCYPFRPSAHEYGFLAPLPGIASRHLYRYSSLPHFPHCSNCVRIPGAEIIIIVRWHVAPICKQTESQISIIIHLFEE